MNKILLLDQFADLGGAQQCLLDLLPALLEAGYRPVVAAPGVGPLHERAAALGVPTQNLAMRPLASEQKPLREHLLFPHEIGRIGRQLREIAREVLPGLLYVNGPRLLPAVAWEFGASFPVVFHCHNHIRQASAAALMRWAIRRCRASVIACCHYAARPIRRAASGARFRVVYNGVAGPRETVERDSRQSETRFGVVGRLSPEKGQHHFLEAAKMLAKALPRSRFVVCGDALFGDSAGHAYRQRLREMAAGLPAEFLGWRDDPGAVIRSLDILVVPSLREPATTRVVLEAFAQGTPVAAYATGGIPEVVEHGVTGFLIDRLHPQALGETLLGLILRNQEALEQAARNARQRWSERYRVERFRREIVATLASLGGAATLEPPNHAAGRED